jgi:hypothetical protein
MKNNNIIGILNSKEEIASLRKAMIDIFYFSNFVYIIHPMRGKVQFKLYPFQKSVLWEFLNNRFNIVLKFRQAGITELIALFCLWTALFKENQNIQIISIKDKVAKKVLRRIKYMYKNLPPYMQVRVVNGTGSKLGTSEELEFENGSSISSIPTTEDAGRSEAVSLLVIDEAAILRWASTIWAAAFPTLSTGGSAIVNSCVTGDTEIMTKNGPLRIDKIAPKEFGRHSLEYLGLEALTHTGKYKRILGAVNKGDLETWEVVNNKGKVLKCTPAHKLLTINGWRTVKQIVEKGLKPIFYDLYTQEEPPVTRGSRSRKIYTSKIKVKRKYIDTIYDISVEDDQSYLTLSQYVNHNTPFGIGNWFHQMWVEACSGGSGNPDDFNPIRLFWDMHPERDVHWYNSMKNILGPRRTAQEIDGDFLTSGSSVFDLMDIKAIEDQLSEFIPIKLGLNGNLRIYKAPEKGKKYFIGADIASGRARDYSAFTVMDIHGEEMACFKGKITIERFAKLLFDIARVYNNALLAPESNDIGQGVIKLLQEWSYPNLYYTIQLIKEKNNKKPKKAKIPGWVTSTKNRHTIIMELEADVRNDEVIIKDPFFVQEAYTFIYNEMNKPIAMGKDKVKGDQGDEMFDQVYSDDAILAKSITNFVRKGKYNSVVVAPK